MNKIDEEKLNKIPEQLKAFGKHLLSLQFDEFDDDNYEINKWYRYSPANAYCSRKEPYHGCIKVGSENNLLIVFLGGGVSVDEFTAKHPNCLYERIDPNFYFDDTWLLTDPIANKGLGEISDRNPFKNWSIIIVGYANGDFHTGNGEFEYIDLNGQKKTLYHHGYKNYHLLLDKIKKYVPNPENIFITGFSAGAFATSILTDDICNEFKNTKKIYSLVDAALLISDKWKNCSRNVWHQKESISKYITSNNIVLDTMVAAYNNHHDRLVQMYTISIKDMLLIYYQCYFEHKVINDYKEGDDLLFMDNLRNTINQLIKVNPDLNIYLYDRVVPSDNPHNLTQHCYIMSDDVYNELYKNIKPIDWIKNILNGKVEKIGLDLLK